jgi:hypothetical protein
MSLSFTAPVFSDSSIKRMKRLSMVLYPGLPPCRMLPRIPASSIIGVSLLSKIGVKSLLMQLFTVIPL